MNSDKYQEGLLISAIQNGTVIDHITGGEALIVLRILGITGSTNECVSVATNVVSSALGRKDVVKIENRELKDEEVDRIALIAPKATINIIRERRVVEKKGVDIPDTLIGVLKCPNPCCITNTHEPVSSRFSVQGKRLICDYCDTVIGSDISSHII
ncbi:MAG TPA: aspartate carbamoyltransferase regulatory subunit [Methanospirillum sp.]|jgi:aspartate carbamoyltransferase regulatory subunit|uniref:aspartate carbamoyltransferase regulatory subunit n=1 Tax=Methanospirillum sp. TaxID=45200 RepID=UPI002CD5B2BA|nr:aspartate carbamoyltransferase regulatory subunit [Methanospirillum sp.]HWQ63202.1 aspartate carbamoyltransferase regulatory subunit [Methanospirillum sp.]